MSSFYNHVVVTAIFDELVSIRINVTAISILFSIEKHIRMEGLPDVFAHSGCKFATFLIQLCCVAPNNLTFPLRASGKVCKFSCDYASLMCQIINCTFFSILSFLFSSLFHLSA